MFANLSSTATTSDENLSCGVFAPTVQILFLYASVDTKSVDGKHCEGSFEPSVKCKICGANAGGQSTDACHGRDLTRFSTHLPTLFSTDHLWRFAEVVNLNRYHPSPPNPWTGQVKSWMQGPFFQRAESNLVYSLERKLLWHFRPNVVGRLQQRNKGSFCFTKPSFLFRTFRQQLANKRVFFCGNAALMVKSLSGRVCLSNHSEEFTVEDLVHWTHGNDEPEEGKRDRRQRQREDRKSADRYHLQNLSPDSRSVWRIKEDLFCFRCSICREQIQSTVSFLFKETQILVLLVNALTKCLPCMIAPHAWAYPPMNVHPQSNPCFCLRQLCPKGPSFGRPLLG